MDWEKLITKDVDYPERFRKTPSNSKSKRKNEIAKELYYWSSQLGCKSKHVLLVSFHTGIFRGQKKSVIGTCRSHYNSEFNDFIISEYKGKVFWDKLNYTRRFKDGYEGFSAYKFYNSILSYFKYIVNTDESTYLQSSIYEESEITDVNYALETPTMIDVGEVLDYVESAFGHTIYVHNISLFCTDENGYNGRFRKINDMIVGGDVFPYSIRSKIVSNYPFILLFVRLEGGHPRLLHIDLIEKTPIIIYNKDQPKILAKYHEVIEETRKCSAYLTS